MQRISREEAKSLTDRELMTAHDRILRDYSLGLLDDRVVPVENTLLLEEELRKRGYSPEARSQRARSACRWFGNPGPLAAST